MTPSAIFPASFTAFVQQVHGLLERIPHSLIAVLLRLGIIGVFWNSAMTKLVFSGGAPDTLLSQFLKVISFQWTISDSAYMLFEYEYTVPLLPSRLATELATMAELTFPILLFFGLFTRYAALALLGMTTVIQIFVYPHAWMVHSLWAGALLFLAAQGGGMLSVDHLIKRKLA